MSISIFAKRAFLSTNRWSDFESKETMYKGYGHLMRVSSMIRADQIADRLNAKLNPETGYEKDVCIYVKPHVKATEDFKFGGKRAYVDIIDGWGLIPLLERYPEVGVIACSKKDQKLLSKILQNKVVFIPQHHCNFDRIKRTRKGIKTIGVIGTRDAFLHLPEGLEEELERRGIKLLLYSKFFSREDIIDFYKQIDVQIVWRPYRMRLSNPLKLVNAASFGIPTIAYDEDVFGELLGHYVPIKTLEGLLMALDMFLETPSTYQYYSNRLLQKAEEYHIDNVAKEYKKL